MKKVFTLILALVMLMSLSMMSFASTKVQAGSPNTSISKELQYKLLQQVKSNDGMAIEIQSSTTPITELRASYINGVGVSLIRSGDTSIVQVYMTYAGTQQANAVTFSSLKIWNGSLLWPETYKTYTSKTVRFPASNLGFGYVGDISIPTSEDSAACSGKGVKAFVLDDASWHSFTNISGSWIIN